MGLGIEKRMKREKAVKVKLGMDFGIGGDGGGDIYLFM